MTNIRQLIWITVVLSLGFGAFWASRSPDPVKTPPVNSQKIRFAVPKGIITAPVLLAQHKGYFSDAGLNIEFMDQYSSGKTAFEAMLRGEADVSVVATTPVVLNSFVRDDFFIFATFTTSYEGVKIIARQDLGIHRATDLKGKAIGIVPGTISQLFLDSMLAYNRILPQEVSVKRIKPDSASHMLKSGDIQAVSIWEPFAYNIQKANPDTSLRIPSSNVYRIAICLSASKNFASRNPGVLEKILLAMERTTSFMNSQVEQAQNELGQLLNMEPEPVKRFWEDTDFGLSLDQVLLMTMENEAAWLIAQHFEYKRNLPDFLRFVNCDPMEAVKPQAVTIVRKSN